MFYLFSLNTCKSMAMSWKKIETQYLLWNFSSVYIMVEMFLIYSLLHIVYIIFVYLNLYNLINNGEIVDFRRGFINVWIEKMAIHFFNGIKILLYDNISIYSAIIHNTYT